MIINDVTQLNPISVLAVSSPKSTDELRSIISNSEGPVSIGGGRFSMGGQTASPNSLHIDMRAMNQVITFSPSEKYIRVQAGIRWCDIQQFIDPHNLSVKIMQTYANFTVGGSLGVNVHGRYIGMGPLIMSVRSILLVLANGELMHCTPEENPDVFNGAIGGYGGLGVIAEAELELADNVRVERKSKRMPASSYLSYFRENVRNNSETIFHNADIYPDHYSRVNAVSWNETKKSTTNTRRLMSVSRGFWFEKYFFWVFSETISGNWRREHIIDPLLFLFNKVHWRNYEAGYDVAELEPLSRSQRTYVLQEYFVPIDQLGRFLPLMTEILRRHRVNVINISIRHALQDPGSMMAWAREEVFAFVLYYKQRTRDNARARVAIWTRELIDAAIACSGTYYLPYQVHARQDQFHAAYPGARKLFALKQELDPNFRFRNIIWDTYYQPGGDSELVDGASEFHKIYQQVERRDRFYWFLQNVFRVYPEDRFHSLICEAVDRYDSDEDIYRYLLAQLPSIKSFTTDFTHALPALFKQKKIISGQTFELTEPRRSINGYMEIGSTGRYFSALRKQLEFSGPVYFLSNLKPGYGLADVLDRGSLRECGRFIDMQEYQPIADEDVADESLELVTCYIGLHHILPDRRNIFIESLVRKIRPGGVLVLRDHDVPNADMHDFVSLVHTVFNAGTGETWETNAAEPRHFESLDFWVQLLASFGLVDSGKRLYQDHDPSDNVLMSFEKGGQHS
jgi:FAD/FMN-containing dehydrogenase/SAM-dependent methyltransferase